jgi:hypothetical protein
MRSDNEDAKYLMMLCNENPDIVIKTDFGIGKYKFVKFNELQGSLVLQFELLEDNKFKDTGNINSNIGNTCFLSISQYLYVYNCASS